MKNCKKTWTAITFISNSERRRIFFFENVIKAKIKREVLPSISEVIEAKKWNLVENVKSLIEEKDCRDYIDLSRELLEIENDAEMIISALIKKFYWNQLKEENYAEIKQDFRTEKSSKSSSWENRLFVAKWRKSWISNPWDLLNFLWTETWISMKNAGKIEIFNDFSYINVPEYEAEIILQVFKQQNKRKPVVVKAKAKTNDSFWRGRRWCFRWKR